MPLFSISNKEFSILDFLNQYDSAKKIDLELEKFEKSTLIQYEENNLESKYPEYKFLRQEYKDGLLLFEIMNQKVWSKITEDTIALKKYYEEHKNDYKTEEELKIAKIVFSDTSSIKPFKQPINGAYFPLTQQIEYLESKTLEQIKIDYKKNQKVFISLVLPQNISESDSIKLFKDLNWTFSNMEVVKLIYSDENKIYLQLLSEANELLAKNNERIESASTEKIRTSEHSKWSGKKEEDFKVNVDKNGMIEFNYVLKNYPPQQKTYNEAKAELMEDYQKHLENEWLKELKKKYSINVNESVLNKLKEKIEQ